MSGKACFTKTLGLVLKRECNDVCFNKLYLNQDNIRVCGICCPLEAAPPLCSNLKDPGESRTTLSGEVGGTIFLPREQTLLPTGCYGMLASRTGLLPATRARAPVAVS